MGGCVWRGEGEGSVLLVEGMAGGGRDQGRDGGCLYMRGGGGQALWCYDAYCAACRFSWLISHVFGLSRTAVF